MYTRCTHCDTVFRVTPQQLQVSSGKVRCGRCNEVFDAFSSLSAQLPAAQQEVADAPRAVRVEQLAAPSRAMGDDAHAGASQTEAGTDAGAEQLDGVSADAQASPPAAFTRELAEPAEPRQLARAVATVAEDVGREVPVTSVTAPGATPAAARSEMSAEEDALTLPDELFAKATPAPAHWAWGVGSAALAVLALAQSAWIFATPLANQLPALRPVLESFCAGSGCRVALPRLPDQLFIEASDLQLLDAAHPNEVLLTVTIRNRAAVAQAYPLLELTLTGVANQVTSRKVFQPLEYAEAGSDLVRGIGANQEVAVRLYLSTGNLRPAGYRVYVYFG
jgi:predicted Zn finger-like uncharacterized protein